jgi:hypothetical protein
MTILTHQTSYFDLPAIGANARPNAGHIDDRAEVRAQSVISDDCEDPRPVTVSLIRLADNDPKYTPLLDYRIDIYIGEIPDGGDLGDLDEVVSFYDIDRAEAHAQQILAAVAAARADLAANSAFVTGGENA